MSTRKPKPLRAPPVAADPLLSVVQVASWLNCSTKHVYALCQQRRLAHTFVGRLLRVPRSSVQRYLDEQTVDAVG